jgi:hypothetical protein
VSVEFATNNLIDERISILLKYEIQNLGSWLSAVNFLATSLATPLANCQCVIRQRLTPMAPDARDINGTGGMRSLKEIRESDDPSYIGGIPVPQQLRDFPWSRNSIFPQSPGSMHYKLRTRPLPTLVHNVLSCRKWAQIRD